MVCRSDCTRLVHLFLNKNGERDGVCGEMPDQVHHLEGNHIAVFWSQGGTNTVQVGEHAENCAPQLHPSISLKGKIRVVVH